MIPKSDHARIKRAIPKTTQNPDLDRANGSRGHKNAFCVFKRRAIMAQGTVKFFNAQKGYGFIVQDERGPDIFGNVSAVQAPGTSSCTFPRSSAPACVRSSRARSCRTTSRLTAAAASRPRPICRRPELRHKCSAGVIMAPAFCFLSRRKRRRIIMPRKPGLNSEFVMFDVVYEDGTQRSNRK